METQGDGGHGAQVVGDVLAGPAVPAGGADLQHPLAVDQLHGQPVELGLDHIGQLLALQPQEALDAGVEVANAVLVEGVVQ